MNPQALINSRITAVILLLAAITISALAPAAARADALDHWTRSQVSTNPIGYMGISLGSVAYGQGRYVAVGSYTVSDTGMIQTSEDGVNWTMRSPQGDSILDLADIAFGDGTFVAVGWDYYAGRNLYHSTDGINWTSHTNATVSNFYRVAYGGGLFVAVGDGMLYNSYPYVYTNLNIYTSPDGITWTGRSSGAPASDVHTITDVAYGGLGRFVAVDDAGYTYTAFSGSGPWTRRVPGGNPPIALSHVNSCNGLFIALGSSGTNYVSYDGLSWSPIVKDVTNDFSRVVYAHGLYAGLSGTNLFTSTNLTNWVQRNLQPPPNTAWGNLAFGNSNLVVVGSIAPPYPSVPLAFVSDPFTAGLAINPGFPPQLTVSGVQGGAYRIEYLDGLRPPPNNWQTLATFSLPSSPLVWTDSTATNSARFYRAALMP
jgi:hypothetical protein